MTETTENPESARPVPPARRWPRRLAIGAACVLLIYLAFPLGILLWKKAWLPRDAPRIAFSPNDTWLEELHVNEAYQVSFTLAQGELVEIQPADTGADHERIAAWLEKNKIAGVLLSGGGDVDPGLYDGDPAKAADVNRARDDFEIALIKVAMEKRLPILGICRGCQILNVARGGTLRNLRDDAKLKSLHFNMSGHAADLAEGSRLSGIMSANRLAKVQSLHYQAVGELGRGLRVSATGPGGVIEAIEGTGDVWVVAVQWHPELSVGDRHQNALLKQFVNAAKNK